ncbi:MAG: carbohydrate ABC transporter permease [SAR324 cluster bacterium]|nr:carbohydrate ABC transporter permease [SAR324 cluster bacterium]
MSKIIHGTYYLLLIIIAFLMLIPLIVMFSTSVKSDEFLILKDLGSMAAFWPGVPEWENYQQILGDPNMPFLRFLLNTLIIVFSIVFLGIGVNSMAAYALSRLKFRGKGLIIATVIALIIIPVESLVIPLLLLVNRLGWIDSYHVQIIPFIAHPFSIFLFYQFFNKIPKSLDDAAKVDGADFLQIYWRIILPMSLPVIVTVAILQGLEFWNSFLWPLMVTRGIEYRPISVALAQFFGRDPKVWGDIMAFTTLASLPLLVVYFVFQRWFIQSAIGSSIKG